MLYALMIYLDPTAVAPEEGERVSTERGDVYADWSACTREMHEAGVLVAGEGLAGPETTTAVRVRGSEVLLTDGPFVEAKELLVGFYMLDTPDLDAALDWAARLPMVTHGTIEVRPVIGGAHSAFEVMAAS